VDEQKLCSLVCDVSVIHLKKTPTKNVGHLLFSLAIFGSHEIQGPETLQQTEHDQAGTWHELSPLFVLNNQHWANK
jgi:hypothetical protein